MLNKAYYDLHVHSCLSPCGDVDMTPNNIAGMASIKGLNVVALTDHNSCKNCPAFFEACSNYGITAIAGMEITTSEDIHVVALFESLDGAMSFDESISSRRILIENDPEIFGNQIIMDGSDRQVGEEKHLLINALEISIDDLPAIVHSFSGLSYPAHIDKNSNSIISVFGTVPEYDFTTYEFADIGKSKEFSTLYPVINGKQFVTSSDAHYLWDINEKSNHFDVHSDLSDFENIRKEFFAILRGNKK